MGIQDYVGHVVKLGGYLPVHSAAGGVRHRGVDPSMCAFTNRSDRKGPKPPYFHTILFAYLSEITEPRFLLSSLYLSVR
jgi:hypothetical protein